MFNWKKTYTGHSDYDVLMYSGDGGEEKEAHEKGNKPFVLMTTVIDVTNL